MRIFTKLILVTTLMSTHLVSFAGITPTYKGGNTLWKLMPEKAASLPVSANNARPDFVDKDDHTCSKIYASAVSQVFHVVEKKQSKSMYANITLAAFAPGSDIKPTALPSINAYPNPSRGFTRLALTLPGNDNYKIRISNTIGKVLAVQEVAPSERARVDLDLSSLPSGVYFYSLLVNGKTVETKRLVLQK